MKATTDTTKSSLHSNTERKMENLELEKDPVIQEIRAIREQISKETAGLSDQQLLQWYQAEAKEALSLASPNTSEQ